LVTCNHCKGDGKLQCSICVGRGTVYSAKAGKQVPCKSCGGDGRFGQCPWCYGSGRIYK
jgi:DnaJ-class molecular chaperone